MQRAAAQLRVAAVELERNSHQPALHFLDEGGGGDGELQQEGWFHGEAVLLHAEPDVPAFPVAEDGADHHCSGGTRRGEWAGGGGSGGGRAAGGGGFLGFLRRLVAGTGGGGGVLVVVVDVVAEGGAEAFLGGGGVRRTWGGAGGADAGEEEPTESVDLRHAWNYQNSQKKQNFLLNV